MKWINKWLIAALIQANSLTAISQVDHPYHVNGSAFQETCNCYTLTPDQLWQSGSMWNINKISLNEPFDFKFNLYLGCYDGDGADGIAFVLQPISTSIGAQGGAPYGVLGLHRSHRRSKTVWRQPAIRHIRLDDKRY